MCSCTNLVISTYTAKALPNIATHIVRQARLCLPVDTLSFIAAIPHMEVFSEKS